MVRKARIVFDERDWDIPIILKNYNFQLHPETENLIGPEKSCTAQICCIKIQAWVILHILLNM